jgi:hypothetical protein
VNRDRDDDESPSQRSETRSAIFDEIDPIAILGTPYPRYLPGIRHLPGENVPVVVQ